LSKIADSDIFDMLEIDLNKGFRLVVERYSSRLYWHIRRLVILHEDVNDALQNTFINAWRHISNFRSESSLYTWLYAIATNEALALINKRVRNSAASLHDLGAWFADSM
jgi:RNA polymerase sigma-70 factor (ECF subfamily)